MKNCERRQTVKLEYQTNQEAIDYNDIQETQGLDTINAKSFAFQDYPGQQKGKKFNNGDEKKQTNSQLVSQLRQQANFANMTDKQIQEIISSNEKVA